ncbi:hypothetical protein QE390_004764 [Siphonobacter sp. SORGH_AS 1065]|nr:hypothetical protein [Siphonobacter sp. SORGH_AS_1065]
MPIINDIPNCNCAAILGYGVYINDGNCKIPPIPKDYLLI